MNIQNINLLCMGCFAEHEAPVNTCPVCGYDESSQTVLHQLRPHTILNGKYLLGKVLGEGGFGITYIGWDINLQLKVAIKEYYPTGFVSRETTVTTTVTPFIGSQGDFFLKGRERFIGEARALAKFFSLPGIVLVKDYFQENGTAYIVMAYIEGQTLKSYLEKMGGTLPAAQVFDMMKPVMTSLAEVHNSGLIHRDISPDNIMISKDGLKLLDFGAARDFTDSGNKSLSVMLKPGFAPEEQYRSKGKQGPWTDVYALCATMYKCVTGITPDEALDRIRTDEVMPPSALGVNINPSLEAALMKGMAVLQENRWQSVRELSEALYGTQSGAQPAAHAYTPQPPATAYPAPKPTYKPVETSEVKKKRPVWHYILFAVSWIIMSIGLLLYVVGFFEYEYEWIVPGLIIAVFGALGASFQFKQKSGIRKKARFFIYAFSWILIVCGVLLFVGLACCGHYGLEVGVFSGLITSSVGGLSIFIQRKTNASASV